MLNLDLKVKLEGSQGHEMDITVSRNVIWVA